MSYVFPEFDNPAQTAVIDWSTNPRTRNEKIPQSVRSSGDAALCDLAHRRRLEEVAAGYTAPSQPFNPIGLRSQIASA